MKKLIPNNITLEKIKKSNYWELIALVVCNHYRETKYQDENLVEISEDWYAVHVSGNGDTWSSKWKDPKYKEEGYIRTLIAIFIQLKRNDYITNIIINTINGNISVNGYYLDEHEINNPTYRYCNLDVTNWMLDNNLLKFEETDIKQFVPKTFEHDLNDKNNI